MVTFSLGGKDYGVDIMRVKEIAKFEQFTYVPNTQPFVSGVYNLRGDIISVIDLRVMFNLPASQRSAGDTQDGLIIRLDTGLIGVIVDSIDKVVGIASDTIQPPHPIFADINIRYISGVVEHDSKLYIILDSERILGESADEPPTSTGEMIRETGGLTTAGAPTAPLEKMPANDQVANIAQTLSTLTGFTVTDLNRRWVERRVEEWQRERAGNPVTNEVEAEEFLRPFYSVDTGRFWQGGLMEGVMAALPRNESGNIAAWNPGSGKGFESYSLAVALKRNNPEARIKVWASDSDLISVSTAPNLSVDERAIPDGYKEFVVEGTNGYTFSEEIRKAILFEFSDLANTSNFPPSDVIVMRDVLSFLSEGDQARILRTIGEQSGPQARIVVGDNEDLTAMGGFTLVSEGSVRVYAPE